MDIREFEYAVVSVIDCEVVALFINRKQAEAFVGLGQPCDFEIQETLLNFHTTLEIEA